VTSGLAGIKFSTSPNIFGSRRIINLSPKIMISTPIKSLIEKNGWKGILSRLEFNPKGLLEPVWCRNTR
jgi:hypothetical protein